MFSAALCTITLLFCTAQLPPTRAQSQGCPTAAQPAPAEIYPPSGTTGTDVRQSTYYTISGQQLDQVASISVSFNGFVLATENLVVQNSSFVQFYIAEALQLQRRQNVNATVSLIPTNSNCSATNLTVTLYNLCKFRFA